MVPGAGVGETCLERPLSVWPGHCNGRGTDFAYGLRHDGLDVTAALVERRTRRVAQDRDEARNQNVTRMWQYNDSLAIRFAKLSK